MKPKTTLNLLKVFFSNIIQKTIQFLPSFFEKKTWPNLFGISYTLPVTFYSSIIFVKAVFNITTSKTDKNENIKSAPPEEKYYYALQIANF